MLERHKKKSLGPIGLPVFLAFIADIVRQSLRPLTDPLSEMRYQFRERRLRALVKARPMAGGSTSLLEHYREKLNASITEADGLTEQVGELLKAGKTLEDAEVVSLTEKRSEVHEAIESFSAALKEEQTREGVLTTATEAMSLESKARSGWVAPQTSEKGSQKQGGPTPFENFGQFMRAVHTAGIHPDQVHPGLKEIQESVSYAGIGLAEAPTSAGGFLVQTDFESELLRRIHDTGKLISLPRHIPISGTANGLKINAIDEASRVDGSRLGGVRSYWGPEGGTLTGSRPTFRQIELSLHKLHCLYYATEEELSDTVALEETVAGFVAEELGFDLDDKLIRGLGSGQPLGILGHAGTVSVAQETGQGIDSIIAENVENMFARMWARSVENAVFLINQDCWPQLFQMGHAVGVGGVPVYLPSNNIAGAPFGTILGRPVLPIEQCATVGDTGDIILADFSRGYVMIDKGGVAAAVSIHVQFLTDESVFRFTMRTDGQPVANVPLTPYQGTQTQSSFVVLDTRV